MFDEHSLQVVGSQVARICRVNNGEGIVYAEVRSATEPLAEQFGVFFHRKMGPESLHEHLASVFREVLMPTRACLQMVCGPPGQDLGRESILWREGLTEVAIQDASV